MSLKNKQRVIYTTPIKVRKEYSRIWIFQIIGFVKLKIIVTKTGPLSPSNAVTAPPLIIILSNFLFIGILEI